MVQNMSKSTPILFSGPMVKAILDGRKSQTRRIVNGRGKIAVIHQSCGPMVLEKYDPKDECGFQVKYPYTVGTLLWVKETFLNNALEGYEPVYLYRADGDDKPEDRKWKPSIFMPRKASRITLEVTGVRVERLQDISDDDCIAEGCIGDEVDGADQPLPTMCFQFLWQSINGPESWEKNPWVWVIQFKKL